MRVLWFEVTEPSGYRNSSLVIAGWQDSLEKILASEDIELIVAFEDKTGSLEVKKNGNVTYVPISTRQSILDRFIGRFSWKPMMKGLLEKMPSVVECYKPDLIQVFGTEWPFGLVAKCTKVPTVVHIQGSMVPYNNALFPPNYSLSSQLLYTFPNIKKMFRFFCDYCKTKSRESIERQVWGVVEYYMGRTDWDWSLSQILHKGCKYFHVEEALRPIFLSTDKVWKPSKKMRLVSTGISSFWKGPEMMLKTARILKEMDCDFEWVVAGNMPRHIKKYVENKEKATFEQNNVNLAGFMGAEALLDLLTESTCYVHTAYIENSPNSICEAQVLGVPVVSTNVGGISTLLEGYENSVLVPANDPWRMASAIMRIYESSQNIKVLNEKVKQRHNPENIKRELLNAYRSIAGQKR